VESPAKAVSVQKYLGEGHVVLASYGHVRDLVEKSGSVVPERGFEMVWEERARDGVVRDILRAARSAGTVVLATDPDREGEAISWHILELLKREGIVNDREHSERSRGSPSVQRVTFTEVTKSAVLAAFAEPRDVSAELVDAYLARRALDYLFGFSLSGVLWRKMPSAQRLSAGRVQSVALRLVCDREFEIEKFRKEEYWSVRAALARDDAAEGAARSDDVFAAELTHARGSRLGKMEPGTRLEAEACAAEILEANEAPGGLVVRDVVEKDVARAPKPPFTTSTMQQEASSKLGFGAGRTMSAAQALYEGRGWGEGLITYMRTDGLHVSPEAVAEIRAAARAEFGPAHVPAAPNAYRKKQKNAQEAHEAIRPTSAGTLPRAVANRLGADSDEARLYGLVWARTMASQMTPAVTKRVAVDVRRAGDDAPEPAGPRLKANGSRLVFAGHLAAYDHVGTGGSNARGSSSDAWLPDLKAGDAVRLTAPSVEVIEKDPDAKRGFGAAAKSFSFDDPDDSEDKPRASSSSASAAGVTASQHWTQPPGRYTEGTLVKALEEKGIGRPSTYASILRVITKRGYVTGSGGRGPLVPETRGRLVSSFLSHFFAEYVDYGFTAELEDALDDVANGEKRWRDTLADFWGPFQGDVESIKGVRTSLVVDVLDATLGVHFFGDDEAALEHQMRAIQEATEKAARDHDPDSPYPALAFDPETLSERRKCPSCAGGRLGLKLSRTGGFIGCSNYPACGHARSLVASADGDEGSGGAMDFPVTLGADPISGRRVSIRNGPYGPYLELEVETPSAEAEAAARAAREMQDAVELARLEEEAAREAEAAYAAAADAAAANGEKPPRRKKPKKVKLPKRPKSASASKPRRFGLRNLEIAPELVTLDLALDLLAYPKTLGAHPEDGEPVVMNAGPFGWYVSHAGVNASLPKKLLREERRRAAALARGEAGVGPEPSGADAADEADARAWARAATEEAEEEAEEEGGEDEGKAAFAEEAVCRDANAEPSGNDGDEEGAAAALRASFGPASLAVALEVLARKRSKPAGAGRGRWGRKKKGAEDGKTTSAESPSGSSTEAPAKTTSAAEKSAPPKKKRAPSSYMLYCAEARASLPEGLKVPEQAKLLGASWKALSEEERSRFTAAAAAAKATLASEAGVSEPKKTKKRAPSAYLLYCAEARASLPAGLKVTEQAKLLGTAWKSLDASERSRFERAAAEAKEATTA
jgi:DNA topoisomerase-1